MKVGRLQLFYQFTAFCIEKESTLSCAIAALKARLVVIRLGAEDQALDGDQHLVGGRHHQRQNQ